MLATGESMAETRAAQLAGQMDAVRAVKTAARMDASKAVMKVVKTDSQKAASMDNHWVGLTADEKAYYWADGTVARRDAKKVVSKVRH